MLEEELQAEREDRAARIKVLTNIPMLDSHHIAAAILAMGCFISESLDRLAVAITQHGAAKPMENKGEDGE